MKCLNCNSDVLIDTSIRFISEPPQYLAICPNCGYHKFIFCKDIIYE